LKIIYIKESKRTCDIIKILLFNIKKIFNLIKVEYVNENVIYYLPIFKDSKITKYIIKKISNKINRLLEKDGTNTVVLSEYLSDNQLFKNYLFSRNINILDGRYLFKCLTNKILEYIFKIKGKKMELRRSFCFA